MSNSQLLLEEYKELGLCWRHDDQLRSKLTSILLPLSIAALTIPYLKPGPPKLLCACGGLMLMMFWFVSSCLYMRRFNIRFSRIQEIERTLGFDSHLRYHREIDKSRWKFRNLHLIIFLLYEIIALAVLWNTKAGSAKWIVELVASFENLVYSAIAVGIGIGFYFIHRNLVNPEKE